MIVKKHSTSCSTYIDVSISLTTVQSSIFSQFAAVGGNPFNHFSLLLQKLKICKFFREHSRFTGQQGKEEAVSLTPLYHQFQIHLDISWEITAESSTLRKASFHAQVVKH